MKLYHAMHRRSKSRHFFPASRDHLCHASDLMLALSSAEVETLPPPDDGRLATLPPAETVSVSDSRSMVWNVTNVVAYPTHGKL
jgi:hypothetical protein